MTTATAPTPEMTPVPAPQEVVEAPKPSPRLASLDALRGFDMFWIIGADALVNAITEPLMDEINHPKIAPVAKIIHRHMDHVDWFGFHFYDLIFPMFVFIVGASLVFSLRKAIDRGGKAQAVRRVIIRGLVLYLFGILYYGGLGVAFGHNHAHRGQAIADVQGAFARIIYDIRFMGVLQRIAICYTIAGLLFCFFRPIVLGCICVGFLLAYWAMLALVHLPGQDKISYKENENIANYVDVHYLPGFKWDDNHDPEGLLSTIPAVAGCLLGVFAGLLLRNPNLGGLSKTGLLVFGGIAFVALGMIWGGMPFKVGEFGSDWTIRASMQFPVVKKVWTSSFVLITAGYSALLLGIFYLVVDVLKLRFLVSPFLWIGMNAITLYLVWHITDDMQIISSTLTGHPAEGHQRASEIAMHLPPNVVPIAQAAVGLLLILILARFLYKRQIFLRV